MPINLEPLQWSNAGQEPSDALKTSGFAAGYKPPAAYFNFKWKRDYDLFTAIITLLNSLEASFESFDIDANSILTKLKTVDGAGSGLDADKLDGNEASAFATASHTHSEYAAVNHTHSEYAASSHTHSNATQSASGFMSSTDKTALDNLAAKNLIAYEEIPQSANLNNYKTPGIYYCKSSTDAATLSNAPITNNGFVLIVMPTKNNGTTQYYTQIAFSANSNYAPKIRYMASSTSWTGWAGIEAYNADTLDGKHASDFAKAPIYATSVEVATGSFVDYSDSKTSDETDVYDNGYIYRAEIPITGVTANMFAEVVFSETDRTSGVFAGIVNTYAGGVYIYANNIPSASTVIPSIVAFPMA